MMGPEFNKELDEVELTPTSPSGPLDAETITTENETETEENPPVKENSDDPILKQMKAVKEFLFILSSAQMEFSKALRLAATKLEQVVLLPSLDEGTISTLGHAKRDWKEEFNDLSSCITSPRLCMHYEKVLRKLCNGTLDWSRLSLEQSNKWEKQSNELGERIDNFNSIFQDMDETIDSIKEGFDNVKHNEFQPAYAVYLSGGSILGNDEGTGTMNSLSSKRRSLYTPAMSHLLPSKDSYCFTEAERKSRVFFGKMEASRCVLVNTVDSGIQGRVKHYEEWFNPQNKNSLYSILEDFVQEIQFDYLDQLQELFKDLDDFYYEKFEKTSRIVERHLLRPSADTIFPFEPYVDVMDGPLGYPIFGMNLDDLLKIPKYTFKAEYFEGSKEEDNSKAIPFLVESVADEIEYRLEQLSSDEIMTSELYCTDPDDLNDPALMDDLRYAIESMDTSTDELELIMEEEPRVEVLGILMQLFLAEMDEPLINGSRVLEELEKQNPEIYSEEGFENPEFQARKLNFEKNFYPILSKAAEPTIFRIFQHVQRISGTQKNHLVSDQVRIWLKRFVPCLTGLPWKPNYLSALMIMKKYKWRCQFMDDYYQFYLNKQKPG